MTSTNAYDEHVVRNYVFDTRFGAYASFFDHAWADEFLKQANKQPFKTIADTLCLNWKGAANTARLPWLMVKSLGDFADSYTLAHESSAVRTLNITMKQLATQVTPQLNVWQQKSAAAITDQLSHNLATALRDSPFKADRETMWQDMMKLSEFNLGVITSQRLAFAAIYYAYEDFVVSCYSLAAGDTNFKMNPKMFYKDLEAIYSTVLSREIWTSDEVRLARLVRNAIAHNGCRETKVLANFGHQITVVDGELQITAPLVHAVFHDLKLRASTLLNETLSRVSTS